MNNWKHYTGSILLAGLLLQGCSSDTTEESNPTVTSEPTNLYEASASFIAGANLDAEEQNRVLSDYSLKLASLLQSNPDADLDAHVKSILDDLVSKGEITQAEMDEFVNSPEYSQALAAIYMGIDTGSLAQGSAARGPQRGWSFPIFNKIKDKVAPKIKDGLIDVLDSSIGDKITGAMFDVVLNSEGVTVFMLDQARNSETITQIMIDALDANWDLTEKMCPMLQENAEFGEKFAALAEERESMAHFFFQSVDANMYGCLTDAMLLSNNDAVHHESVSHSTNAYMGILLDRYATTYFITPDQATNPNGYENDASTFKFAGLMMDNGENVIYDRDAKTFEKHGDGNELTNEKFFYSLFKTPGTTDAFVSAMDQLDQDVVTMFMDKIFLGAPGSVNPEDDTVQGYLNIVSIGSAMYDGIYGVKVGETRDGGYGFGAYSNAFIGFAGLIPTDRYFTYGKAFFNAGYEYASFYGIDLWAGATDAALAAWDNFTGTTPTGVDGLAPARSAGKGTLSSDWIDDTLDIFIAGWDSMSVLEAWNSDASLLEELNSQALRAYGTVVDGGGQIDVNSTNQYTTGGNCANETEITNPVIPYIANQYVCGFHGLIELAVREDMINTDGVADMNEAITAFQLPAFADLTWSFAYGAATDGVVAYWNNNVNAKWLADLSTTEFVRNYFYPSEDGIVSAYVPSWMMAIDWLKLPNAVTETNYDSIDLSFDGGYVDVYFVSTLADLAAINGAITIELVDESMIAQDAAGDLAVTRYVYKIRAVSPAQVDAALAYLQGVGEGLIGLDTDNATQTAGTVE